MLLRFITVLLLTPLISQAADCENYSGLSNPTKICWNEDQKAYISENCLGQSGCQALKFLKGRQFVHKNAGLENRDINPSTAYCLNRGLEVVVLSDINGYQQSFCKFKDGSLIDSNSVERKFE